MQILGANETDWVSFSNSRNWSVTLKAALLFESIICMFFRLYDDDENAPSSSLSFAFVVIAGG